ncbi:MAG: pilus assembly protein PilX [Burkholderiaceae bacterium]|nr:pilus assembly protein PilX [Burkholderiaceae bacterium]
MRRTPCHRSPKRQRGISLFVVIVFVMLSMLLALWGARTSLFNEMVVGNDADYQRAFEAAQALIQDAELDIRGERPDGTACVRSIPNVTADTCRPAATALVWFPTEDKEFADIVSTLEKKTATKFCFKGLCLKRTGNQDFWNDKTTLDAMLPEGARYGQFTGAEIGTAGSTGSSPILKSTVADRGGWYWIEVMPYDPNAGNSGLITNGSTNLALNLKPSIAYRITAVARGLKASTQVVLQSTFVRQKVKN